MSWIGGSISSLTGQISNLTKDILTEGTEEVSDHATELSLAREKISEFQTLCGALKSENERLKFINRELEEKAEASELQINTISSQYRGVLQEKEEELKKVKQQHHAVLEHQAKSALVSPLITPGQESSSLAAGYRDNLDGSSADWEFGDNIRLQQDINRLSQQVSTLQTECQHWKKVASQLSGSNNEQFEANNDEIFQLQEKIKELERQLGQTRDQQQHEVISLQDIHSEKVSALKKKHKQEMAELKKHVTTLEQQISDGRDSDSIRHRTSNLPEADRAGLGPEPLEVEELRRELKDLQEKLSQVTAEKSKVETAKKHLEGVLEELQSEVESLQGTRDDYEKKIIHLDSVIKSQAAELDAVRQHVGGEDVARLKQTLEKTLVEKRVLEDQVLQVGQALYEAKQQLLDQLDANHADALEMLGDLAHMRHRMDSDSAHRRGRLLGEKQKLANQIFVLGQKQVEVKSSLLEARSQSGDLSAETADIVESLGSPRHQRITAELVASLEKENLYLKEENVKFQEQITLLEKKVVTLAEEESRREETMNRLKSRLREDNGDEGSSTVSTLQDSLSTPSDSRQSSTSEMSSELSRRNHELGLKVDELQSEVKKYRNDIDQFEYVKSDWQMEKEALEEVLFQLREQLREKEVELNIALTQKGLSDVEIQTRKVEKQHPSRNKAGEVIEETIKAENQGLLMTGDTTREMEIETFAKEKQELNDRNQLLETESSELKKDQAVLKKQIFDMEKKIAELQNKSVHAEKKASVKCSELERRVTQQDTEMRTLAQDKLDLESSLEELDQQHEEAMDKLINIRDNLSQQVDSLNNSLAEKDAEISRLAGDLDQSTAQDVPDSSDAKEDQSKELELLVKKLETEVKSRDLEIKDLKEKCGHAAVVVNDLHMDKRELEEELGKVRKELGNKISKIKELREASNQLVEENKDLTERLQEAEEELDEWQERNEQTQMHKLEVSHVNQVEILHRENSELKAKVDELVVVCDGERTRNNSLLAENQKLSTKVEEMAVQKASGSDQMSDRISVLETQLDVASTEKQRLETELGQLEEKLQAQTKQYEAYIQDLKSNQAKDGSALQKDHQLLQQTCHERELALSDLKSQLGSLQAELDMTKETMQSAVESQGQMTDILKDKDHEISSLKNTNVQLNSEYEDVCAQIREQEILLESMKGMENLLASSKDEIQKLRTEIEVYKSNFEKHKSEDPDKQKTLEIITELEKELAQANNKIVLLEENLTSQEGIINDFKAGISELNDKHELQTKEIEKERDQVARQDDLILILQQKAGEKDNEVAVLVRKLSRACSMLDDGKLKLLEQDETIVKNNMPALEYPEKAAIEYQPRESYSEREIDEEFDRDASPDTTNKLEEISQEIGSLQMKLQDKDLVIEELQKNNSSLLKMLDAKPLTSLGDKALVETHRLESEVKNLKLEREQILSVMNEKSRECSSLKAEVHRLMSVISAEKSALNKLQQDNQMLQNKENPVEEMQKEALKNLSRLVRDREMEIEALKQKNDTLIQVLQDSSQDTQGSQINSLLQDKDNLGKQVVALSAEREQMIAYLNQKHQESVTYHNEIQRLTALIATQTEESEALQRNYSNLVPQFEDNKQMMLKLQNENLNCQQKYNELEVKYGELLGRSNVSDTVDVVTYNSKESELLKCQEKLSELQQEVHIRDQKIHGLSQKIHELESSVSSKEAERTSLRKQADNLAFQLQGVEAELQDVRSESASCQKRSSGLDSEMQMLKDTNNQLTLSLREKEFELSSLREKTGTLTTLLSEQKGEQSQVDHLIQENTTLHNQTVQFQQERDQAVMALKQKQAEVDELTQEIGRLKDKEVKLSRELDRLRQHLIQIEEGYTGEALEAEEREKELRNRLAGAEEKLLSSTSAVQHANQAAGQQVEALEQQLRFVTSQRDTAYMQMTAMQEQCQQYAASLANLQMVLEQFQRDKEAQVSADTERYQDEIKTLKDKINALQTALDATRAELEDASDGLEAASRLSEQLDRKEEAMAALKEEVQLREKTLKVAEEEIKKLTSSTEAKVDKLLMKNMLIGYFHTPNNNRKEVIHMIGGILNFSEEDYSQIDKGQTGWIPGFFRFGSPRTPKPTPPTTPVHSSRIPPTLDQSFSQLFVKFLEKESSPPPPPVKLPAEQMAAELREKQKEAHKPAFNPFTAPRHVSMPLQMGGEQVTSSKSHLLMTPMSPVTQTNPLIAPMSGESLSQPGSGRSTPQNASAILKDVLSSR